MKKIIYTLLVAFVALSFMGCPSIHSDLDPLVDLKPFYLRGNMNNWCNDALTDGALTANEDGTFSITYTAKAEPDEFAIANEAWSTKFCGVEVAVGGDFVDLVPGAEGNAKVTGQVPGNNYKMTINPLSDTVQVKVELAGVNVPSFYVLDATKGLVEIPYDGANYNYEFTPSSDTADLTIWSDKVYYAGEATVGTKKELTASEEFDTLTVSGLVSGKPYNATFTVEDDKVSVTVAKLCPYFIVGDIAGSHVRMTATDTDGVYTYEFTYKNDMSAWGGGNGAINFVITEGNGWNKKITGIALTSDYADSLDNDANATASGLVDGTTYVITLKEEAGKFSAKIEAK